MIRPRASWVFAILAVCVLDARAATPTARPRMGINLAGPADWNTELPFVDVFRLSRTWISQRRGEPFGKGPKLAVDARGWVQKLEPGCWAESPLCTIEGGHYPSGRYVILYEGKGKLDLGGAGKVEERRPGRLVAAVDSRKGGLFLQLLETDPVDPLRNIRVLLPGCEQTSATNPWNPDFLARWRGVACIRFMDYGLTNDSTITRWNDRAHVTDATCTRAGVPLEWMIDLANRLGADPWFCIPHEADDAYVREFAKLVKARLDPARKVYIEYSNEVWNSMFRQHRDAGTRGQKLGLAEKPWEAAWKYTGVRSSEIFRIMEDVFGGHERLTRVVGTQSVVPFISEQILGAGKCAQHADALAIAPYLGFNVRPSLHREPGKTDPTAEEVARWSVEQLLDRVETVILPEAMDSMRKQKIVADKYGLKLVAYEAGQHLVGVLGGENNERLTRLFHAANAHPRMGEIYTRYLDAWAAAGGDLICHFSSVSQWSKWGSWGLLQYADENPQDAPKFRATLRWAKAQGQDVNAP